MRHVLALATLLLFLPSAWAQTDRQTTRVVQLIDDFESRPLGERRPGIVFWNWSAQQKADALTYSSCEIVSAAQSQPGQKCLKLSVSDQLPPNPQGYRMISLTDYLPPEADALRMRIRSLKGRISLALGGPTVYFGHSDVLTRLQSFDPTTHGEWTSVEFSLNHDLTRNMRRAQWSAKSPVIHYTRWVQEPLAIYVTPGAAAEVLFDQIELISRGEGRPFGTFTDAQIQTVTSATDFETPASMDNAFTIFTNATEQPKFDQPPHLVRKAWPPPQIARVPEGTTGRHSLQITMTGAEETCFAGVHLPSANVAQANAIAITLKADYPDAGRPGVVLDFLAYASPSDQKTAFPWDALRPPPAWRNDPSIAFTYYLNPRNPALEKAPFALYHTRRLAPAGQWTTLVLPLADFICNYGQGDLKQAFQAQSPLTADQLTALTFLSYFGQRKPLHLLIDEIRFVKVPGQPDSLRSFYQPRPTPEPADARPQRSDANIGSIPRRSRTQEQR